MSINLCIYIDIYIYIYIHSERQKKTSRHDRHWQIQTTRQQTNTDKQVNKQSGTNKPTKATRKGAQSHLDKSVPVIPTWITEPAQPVLGKSVSRQDVFTYRRYF